MNIQGWFPLGLTGFISLQSKGLSRVFSNTTVQKHQFFSAQPFCSPAIMSVPAYWINHSLTIWNFVGKVMPLQKICHLGPWRGLCLGFLTDLKPTMSPFHMTKAFLSKKDQPTFLIKHQLKHSQGLPKSRHPLNAWWKTNENSNIALNLKLSRMGKGIF